MALDSKKISDSIISKTSDMVIILNENFKIIKINDRVKEITGFNENDLLDFSFNKIIVENEKDNFRNKILNLENNPINNYEINFRLKSDIEIPVKISITQLEDKFKDKIGYIIIGKDIIISKQLDFEIKERRIAEENLIESEDRYKTLLELLPDTVVVHSDRKIVYTNQNGLKMFGVRNEQDILGKDILDFIDKEYHQITYKRIAEMESTGTSLPTIEERLLKSDGTPIEVEISSTPIIYYGKPSIIVVMRDISERKNVEEKLFLATKLESLGVLAGGIAHDFNNLLTAIIGNISVAKLYIKGNEDALSVLSDAENSGFRAKSLTNQLMTFAKGGQPVKKVINLKEIIVDQTQFLLRGSQIIPYFTIENNLFNIEADGDQINQVLSNIIINARQSMNEIGSINIICENVTIKDKKNISLGKGDYIKIAIKDCGCGIPQENLNKIFDPYFSTKKNGNGLGLASVYSIIKKHNGFIDVESKINVGTTFTIYLPATNKNIDDDIDKTIEIEHVSDCRILVMDDETIITTLLNKILTKYGYEVIISTDGEEAVSLYKKSLEENKKIDLVILDLTVPNGMGGKETMIELKKIDKEVKAIISSGYSNDSVINLVDEIGFAGYITKPYKIEDLIATINKAINNAKVN